jgi:hypothetical protein
MPEFSPHAADYCADPAKKPAIIPASSSESEIVIDVTASASCNAVRGPMIHQLERLRLALAHAEERGRRADAAEVAAPESEP